MSKYRSQVKLIRKISKRTFKSLTLKNATCFGSVRFHFLSSR